ncbi:hypothetical protein RHMOL_Rhmol01G0115700 [Rhododendron molle]|uniref:Uncharacterized protein n=1 Tax=Rhododendron molle TaxID=49168 RepID=A0ACC0Q282_RHOML|nr:hypothetical protein RHMOL_Rhmol01G0115700 [Rhododendron molle]
MSQSCPDLLAWSPQVPFLLKSKKHIDQIFLSSFAISSFGALESAIFVLVGLRRRQPFFVVGLLPTIASVRRSPSSTTNDRVHHQRIKVDLRRPPPTIASVLRPFVTRSSRVLIAIFRRFFTRSCRRSSVSWSSSTTNTEPTVEMTNPKEIEIRFHEVPNPIYCKLEYHHNDTVIIEFRMNSNLRRALHIKSFYQSHPTERINHQNRLLLTALVIVKFAMAMALKPNTFHLLQSHKPTNPNSRLLNSSFGPRRIFISSSYNPNFSSSSSTSCSSSVEALDEARRLSHQFDPKIPLQEALTPPSSWYTHPCFLSLEFDRVFFRGWQAVGCTDQIKESGSFFTGRLGNVEYVVCRGDNGDVHAFHNVCRHHASLLAFGSGQKSCFVCPYHGWTYGLDGALLKATRITGIQNFNVNEYGLKPLKVAIWGPFVLLNMEQSFPQQGAGGKAVANEWLGSSSEILSTNGVDSSLSYVCRREYTIECNWKVFCDNYLDGGYHVPYAHKGLASGLKLDSYSTTVFEKVSIQRCGGGSVETEDKIDRLGSEALYAFIYPNFMINRYGPWMDTNLVLPLGPRKCQVIFDYFLDASLKDDKAFIERSLKESERVQMEDIVLSESVQKGLESPAYSTGRYAPSVEKAMHHFHCLLYENLTN